ncbi:MAG TPA: globin domain-containing protein [Micromonosporaceae bacterium]|jgi:NAD(P)H-flavin reductase|nr:globin domain-containing protein [Micromonosporaceae bacterium]
MTSLSTTLKESWTLVEEQQDKVAQYFYARIFLSDPRLRDLFPVQLDVQRARLLGAIVTAVQTIEDPERFDDYLRALGRDHRKFRVESVHFGMIGQALIDSLRAFAGERWSPAYEQAWQDAYRVIARRMLAAAQDDTSPPYWHAEIVSHERRARDIAVFTCRTMQPLTYRAGQYVSIESDRQPRVWRVYSMANSPRPDNTMEFHVRAVGAGWLSGALVRRAQVGDMIRIAAPMGSMTVDPTSTRDIVCVAGGTGLAPIKAIIDEIGQTNRTRWVHLFFGARDREDLYDLDDLMRLTTRYPWLTVTPVTSEDPTYPGERGNVGDVMAGYGPWNDHDVYVSGSPAMVRATLRRLSEIRVPSIRIKYDPFTDQ